MPHATDPFEPCFTAGVRPLKASGRLRGPLAVQASRGREWRAGVRRTRRAVLLLIGVLAIVLSCSGDGSPTGTGGPGREKMWTFMLYDAADLDQVYDPMDDFCLRMNSGAELNVLVMQDTRDDSAKIWYVDDCHVPVVVSDIGEVNTGRSQTLRSFLEYAKQNYPAERYIIAFYGHGRGWLGACQDATDGNDYLTMEEMRAALAETGGAALVLFTGPCLMGALESVYELRDCTEAYVASEDLSFYCWWDYPMADICEMLHDNPRVGNYDLAEFIVDCIREDSGRWASEEWGEDFTISAVRTDRVGSLAGALDSIALDYLQDPVRLRSCMDEVGADVDCFYSQHPDVFDLADEVLRVEEADTTRALLETIRARVLDAVIAECHGETWPGARGLSVYFPFESHSGSSDLYGSETSGLDFTADTHWDELLKAYPYPPAGAIDAGHGPLPTPCGGYWPIRASAQPVRESSLP